MNLFFRFFWNYLLSHWRTKIQILSQCHTPFRVLPSDLDLLFHMNNGIYFSLQDIARLDLMIRSGFWKKIQKKNWYPVVVSEFIRFKRSLNLGEKYQLTTQVVGWDDRYFYLEHLFIYKGVLCAQGFVKTRFLSKDGSKVMPQQILELTGESHPPLSPPPFKEQWNHLESYSTKR